MSEVPLYLTVGSQVGEREREGGRGEGGGGREGRGGREGGASRKLLRLYIFFGICP